MPNNNSSLNSNPKFEQLISNLTARIVSVTSQLDQSHPVASSWLRQHHQDISHIRLHRSLPFSSPPHQTSDPTPIPVPSSSSSFPNFLKQLQLLNHSHLNHDQRSTLQHFLNSNFGICASPQLYHHQLPCTIGRITPMPHLKRFPGDTLDLHDQFPQAGMSNTLSTWGYFSTSKDYFTKLEYLQEKYYFAVVLNTSPQPPSRHPHLNSWYQHRKVLAINPSTDSLVVGVIANINPKLAPAYQFGASPEIVDQLNIKTSRDTNPIILWFVDDSHLQIPLGPISFTP